MGFPCGSDGKESTCNEGYEGSLPGLGRSHGIGNGYPLQYSCLENSMDRGAWGCRVRHDGARGCCSIIYKHILYTNYMCIYVYT